MKTIIRLVTRFIPRRYLNRVSHFFSRIIGLFYLGNKVNCPVCGAKYRKFLPYGRFKTRDNALCPNCLSLERHRLMWLYLQDKTNFFSAPLKILHVAPEYCFIKRFDKLNNLDYITADLESPLAKVKMDVHDIPFEENTFDVVFCNHTMEHVEDDLKAMRELHRVLKAGGWGIIQSPINIKRDLTYEDPSITSEKNREEHFGQKDHVREYGLDYPQRLEKAGFEVDIDKSIEEMDPEQVKRFGLLTYEEITAEDYLYIVKK
ncbi:MAG: class I SAM-dependent methyltransferase [Bacteroidota bacterium]|nr:class I SAM-dependent methyltransferase [Bacteroidota bacterium]